MLVTYPDAVTGGFTVVRRDEDGVLRSHFGFVLNAGDPHACITGYVPSTSTPTRGAVENVDTDAVRCEVVDGVDQDRKSTRLNSSHANISYAVFCLKQKKSRFAHHNPHTAQ